MSPVNFFPDTQKEILAPPWVAAVKVYFFLRWFLGRLWRLLTLLLSELSSWREIQREIRSKCQCLSAPIMSLREGGLYRSRFGVGVQEGLSVLGGGVYCFVSLRVQTNAHRTYRFAPF